MPKPRREAELIVNALFEEFGIGGYTPGPVPHVDGRGAILEMKEDKFPGWADVEWAGYHIKYLVQKACDEKIAGKFTHLIQKRRHLVKGEYVWDARFNANDEEVVILGDIKEYNKLLKDNRGIGVLVADTQANSDLSGEFVQWHEELKGGLSDYSVEREIEGRPPRIRKTEYMIRKIRAYFFKTKDFVDGLDEGWLDNTFQKKYALRNSNENPRNPKYKFKISKVPKKNLVFVKNFNEDAEEFAEEFPGFS